MKKVLFVAVLLLIAATGVKAAVIENISIINKGSIIVSGRSSTSNASIQMVKRSKLIDLEGVALNNLSEIVAFMDVIDNVQADGSFVKEVNFDESNEGFYVIKVNDGLGNEPAVREFYNGDFIIDNFRFTDFNNKPLNRIPLGQPAVAVAQVINYSDDVKEFSVLVGMYDENDMLLDIKKEEYSVIAKQSYEILHYVDIPANSDIKKIKTMIWDSINGMIPYVAAASITHETIHEIFVAANGSDSGIGTIDQPFATVGKALQSAVAHRTSTGNWVGNITIYFRGGEYFIDDTITLGASHSNVTIAGYPDEEAVISGGQRLLPSGFSPVTDSGVLNRIPSDARPYVVQYDLGADGITDAGNVPKITYSNSATFNSLTINDVMGEIARWPNTGYSNISSVVSQGSSSDYTSLEGSMVFTYSGTRPSNWTNATDAWLLGYWRYGWAMDSVKISSINTTLRRITTSGVSSFGLTSSSPGGRYYIFNLIEELDSPGEWYIDSSTNILYLYPTGDLQSLDIQLSHKAFSGFTINNASNIILQNLTVQNVKGTGVVISNSQNISVVNSTLRNLSNSGVVVISGSNCGAYSCEIYSVGASGIFMYGGNRNTLTASGNYAINNEIHDFGKTLKVYRPGIGLHGVGMQAKHNKIYNAPHMAMNFSQNDNLIEYNEIFDVLKETTDSGAIYTGRDLLGYGNIIRYNYIYNVTGLGGASGNNYAMGIYLDDMWSGTTVYGNILNNVECSFMLGGGRNNIFQNNIIMNKTSTQRPSIHLDSRGLDSWFLSGRPSVEASLSAVDYQNEYWQAKYPQAYNTATDDIWYPKYNVVKNNVIYNHMAIDGNSYVSQYGTVENNVMFSTDIGFVDEGGGNLMLNENSVVYTSIPGFKPIPFNKIGLLSKNR